MPTVSQNKSINYISIIFKIIEFLVIMLLVR
jgi:hypothetical protein